MHKHPLLQEAEQPAIFLLYVFAYFFMQEMQLFAYGR